jgi:sulfatase-like protein
MNVKTFVQGFGAAILVLILRVWPLLSSYHPVIYHSFLPMQSVIWGILIDLAAVTLLAAWLFRYLEKSQAGLRTAVWAFVAAELASALVTAFAAMRRAPIPYLSADRAYIVTLLASLALRWLRPLDYRRAVRGFGALLVLAGCSMVWMVPELLYQGLRVQRADARVPVTHRALLSGGKDRARDGGRIVWLLFDELSYDQTFDHRFSGLAMPAFDKFKSQSVVFSDLKPAGYYTDRVIPSFFLGKPVDNIRGGLDGEAMIKLAGNPRWQAFDAHATIFSDAQRLGWATGVVGWYNPYCRILAGTLNYCFWRMGDGQSDGAISDHSALQNAVAPLVEIARGLKHEPGFAQEKHAQDQTALMPEAEALIRDQSIGFVFIHLPVPHPPSVYDRRRQRASGSYIDSLALADSSLAALLGALSGTGSAAKTTVIVCSDHSWRVPMWRSTAYWTKEDEVASQGRFDPRPVLMIHFPGQQAEHDVTAPFDEIRIHEMIERMLRGQEPQFDKALLAGGAALPVAAKP